MRILQINKFYYLRGGSERHFFDLSGLLREKGHDIIEFSMKHERNERCQYEKYFVSNIDFNNLGSILTKAKAIPRVVYSREAKRKLGELIEKEKIDIAHLHNIAHQISPSIIHLLKDANIPIVQTIHDYKLVCPTYNMMSNDGICERCIKGAYYNAIFHKCNKGSFVASAVNCLEAYIHRAMKIYNDVNFFIASSNFVRNKMIQGGIPLKKIACFPHFIRADRFVPSYTHSDYIVYLGRLSPEKGVVTLINAMREFPSLKLLIVGEGPLRAILEKSVVERRMTNVQFLGHKSGKDLVSLIQNAFFVVVPSEWNEVFGLVILEAFAMGKPVLGSRIGAIPELVVDGETGLLFNCADVGDLSSKIDFLCKHPDKVREMGINARRHVESNFNKDVYYDKLMAVYHSAINRVE